MALEAREASPARKLSPERRGEIWQHEIDRRRQFPSEEERAAAQRQSARLAKEQAERYLQSLTTYSEMQSEVKLIAKKVRNETTMRVQREAAERRKAELEATRQREATARNRLQEVALQKVSEEQKQLEEKQQKQAQAQRDHEMRAAKEAERERRAHEQHLETLKKMKKETAERAVQEAEAARKAEEAIAALRTAKREAWDRKARQEAEAKEREAAEVKVRFKASEARRLAEETERKRLERRTQAEMEAAFRQKIEHERALERAQAKAQAKAREKALKEVMAMQYKQDESGKLVKIADPFIEGMKKIRALEEEEAREMAELKALIAEREATREKERAAQELQRTLEIAAAQRGIALVFQQNQEKARRVKEEIEAAERERNRRLAIETRKKIEDGNSRQLKAEREAELALKRAKEMEHQVQVAKAQHQELMCQSEARNHRKQQNERRLAVMWHDYAVDDEKIKHEIEAQRLFNAQVRDELCLIAPLRV